jgi:hypothetical protein
MRQVLFSILVVLLCVLLCTNAVPKKAKVSDPRECEVCIANLDAIDKLIPKDKKSNKATIEKAIGTHCTLSGFGSEWKPNPLLTNEADKKMCYIFEPIKKAISTPFSTGMPKQKVCKRLTKDNPEVCEVKYRKFNLIFNFMILDFLKNFCIAMKVEKKPGQEVDYNSMKVKQLKTILGKCFF